MAGNLENKGRWEFCDLSEIREVVYSERKTPFDPITEKTSSFNKIEKIGHVEFVNITDSIKIQVAILSNNNKYGVYTLDDCYGICGPGIYVNPEKEAFPYDEVVAYNTLIGFCYITFRIDSKWGVLKIAAADYNNRFENFTEIYSSTKRKIVVPCEYDSLDSARNMLFASMNG